MVRLRSNFNTTPRRTAARRGTANCELSESEVVTLESTTPSGARPPNNGQEISADAESLVGPVSKGHEEEPMQIFIKNPEGETIIINDVKHSDTVESVKAKIQIREELHILTFAGRQLEDGRTVSHYNIREHSTLHLAMRLLSNSKEVGCPKAADDTDLEGSTSTAKVHAEAQGRKDKMEKIIQCTVCFSLPFCKIYQCADGHLICVDCYSKMPKPISCPSCRTPMPATPIRNRAAEQVRTITIIY